jgi:hypothetical protein
MTNVVVAAYAGLSIAIVVFHIAAWLAAGWPDRFGDPEGFFARIGWPSLTIALGLGWLALLFLSCWRIVSAPRPRPLAATLILIATVLTPEILSVLVNVPDKGISAVDFLDTFLLFPGGMTPGGNGTLQHIVTSAAVGGIAAVQVAHGLARPRTNR